MDVIKPCKKCGSVGHVVKVGDLKEYFIVKCSNCYYTPVPFHRASLRIESAINEWNGRS